MSTVIKTVKGKKYMYYAYYVNRKKHEKYCGVASSRSAKKKALQFELIHLREQKKHLTKRL